MASLSEEISVFFRRRQDIAVTDLAWLPAQSYSLQLDSRRQSWHAGHVNALLSDGTYVVAGTQTGGVWLLNPSLQPTYGGGHRATPLSNDWETPDISALAYGPDGKTQVYVGTANSDLLFFLELKPGLGEVTLDRVTRIPLPSAMTVFAIAIAQGQATTVHARPRIVLACSNGVLLGRFAELACRHNGIQLAICSRTACRADQWAGAGGVVRNRTAPRVKPKRSGRRSAHDVDIPVDHRTNGCWNVSRLFALNTAPMRLGIVEVRLTLRVQTGKASCFSSSIAPKALVDFQCRQASSKPTYDRRRLPDQLLTRRGDFSESMRIGLN